MECPICLNAIEIGKSKITNCGHEFCVDCYDRIEECSICREKI